MFVCERIYVNENTVIIEAVQKVFCLQCKEEGEFGATVEGTG